MKIELLKNGTIARDEKWGKGFNYTVLIEWLSVNFLSITYPTILFLAKELIKVIMPIPKTALFFNPKGSIYHLDLFPGELAQTIILVGTLYAAELGPN
ncbi:hypothetical protein [Coxiella-like endosymbiont]|uniref:hypothetical protein n=1 Tax=Coxiella-like endosymbiont TaxID=1592897 RepID=UPI00272BB63F|nr:hypothetical protein [Coxiella-like endosymbiont]